MSRRYLVTDTNGRSYRFARTSTGSRLFPCDGFKPHADGRGRTLSASVFPSLGNARQAVADECRAKEQIWSQDVADKWYESVRLVPLAVPHA